MAGTPPTHRRAPRSCRRAVVADQLAREADQNRRQGRQPRPVCDLPDGRGRSAAADVPGNPVADRPAAGTTCAGVRSAGADVRQAVAIEACLNAARSALSPPRCGQLPSSTARCGAWCAIYCCRGRSKGRSLPQTHRESGECRLKCPCCQYRLRRQHAKTSTYDNSLGSTEPAVLRNCVPAQHTLPPRIISTGPVSIKGAGVAEVQQV
jgi:hypothetical protein